MRILTEISNADVAALDQLGSRQGASRAKLIRDAVRDYLARNLPADRSAAFGLWSGMEEDGLSYQERLRSEW